MKNSKILSFKMEMLKKYKFKVENSVKNIAVLSIYNIQILETNEELDLKPETIM